MADFAHQPIGFSYRVKRVTYVGEQREEQSTHFENENPLRARADAIRFAEDLQNVFIETKLLGIEPWLTKGESYKIDEARTEEEFSKLRIFQIEVLFVVDRIDEEIDDGLDFQENQIFILPSFNEEDIAVGLNLEYKYYKKYWPDLELDEFTTTFINEMGESETFTGIPVPIDWDEFKPSDHSEEDYENQPKLTEGKHLEFKSSLRYCYNEKKAMDHVTYSVVKTIAGFLNSDGGLLLVGVDDDPKIIGIEEDLKIFDNSMDKLLLFLDNLLGKYFGNRIHALVKLSTKPLGGKTILWFSVRSSQKPVFIKSEKDKNKESFYIRRFASTAELNGREIVEYVTNHEKFRDG